MSTKKPKRKILVIEVETTMTNEQLRGYFGAGNVYQQGDPVRIAQIQVNDVTPEAKKAKP